MKFLHYFIVYFVITVIFNSDNSFYSSATLSDTRQDGFRKLYECSLLRESVSIQQKYNCLKAVAGYQERRVLSRSSYMEGPEPMKLAIVMFLSTDILASYALPAIAVNLFYCLFNDYALKIFDEEIFQTQPNVYDQTDYRWNKVKVVEQLLLNDPLGVNVNSNLATLPQNDYDYFLWVDADYIFLTMTFRIESIIFDYPGYHFYASAELSGSTTLINSGAFLVRNSVWSKNFLLQWWTFSHRHLYSDQEQFDLLYSHLLQQSQQSIDRIKILDVNRINTDPPAMTKHAPHHPVLHLMGEEAFFRQAIFMKAYGSIHDYIVQRLDRSTARSGTETSLQWFPFPQLGISRSLLLDETIRLYGQEIQILLQQFEQGLDANQIQSYETCRQLSNTVHHYAHAVEYLLQQQQSTFPTRLEYFSANPKLPSNLEIKELRKQVYSLLHRNIQLLQQSVIEYTSDHLETIKSGIIAGQHVLHDSLTLTISQRLTIAQELLALLQYLIRYAHPLQRSSLEMIESSIYIEMSLLSLEDNDYSSALEAVKAALVLTEQHALVSGNHLLFQPLLMKANCLALLGRDMEAIQIYERCLRILQSYDDSSNDPQINTKKPRQEFNQFFDYEIQIYYNYGLLLVQTTHPDSKIANQDQGRSYLYWAKQRLESYYDTSGSQLLLPLMTSEHQDLYQRVVTALTNLES